MTLFLNFSEKFKNWSKIEILSQIEILSRIEILSKIEKFDNNKNCGRKYSQKMGNLLKIKKKLKTIKNRNFLPKSKNILTRRDIFGPVRTN